MDKLIVTLQLVSKDKNYKNAHCYPLKKLKRAVKVHWENGKLDNHYRELKRIMITRSKQKRLCWILLGCRGMTVALFGIVIAILGYYYVYDLCTLFLGGNDEVVKYQDTCLFNQFFEFIFFHFFDFFVFLYFCIVL